MEESSKHAQIDFKRNYCLFNERTTDTLDLGLTLDFLKDDRSKKEMKNDAKHVERLYNKILTTIKEKMTHV